MKSILSITGVGSPNILLSNQNCRKQIYHNSDDSRRAQPKLARYHQDTANRQQMKDEKELCQQCNQSSPLAGVQTRLALLIKWCSATAICASGSNVQAHHLAISYPTHVEHIVM